MIGRFGHSSRAGIGRAVQFVSQPLRKPLGNRAGNAAVEFAIIAPMLVLLLGGIIEIGLAISTYFTVQEGMLAASNYASRKGWDATAITTAVKSSSPKLATATVTVSRFCGCPSGSSLTTVAQCPEATGCPAACSNLCSDNFVARKYAVIAGSVPRTQIMGQTFGLPSTVSITMRTKLP